MTATNTTTAAAATVADAITAITTSTTSTVYFITKPCSTHRHLIYIWIDPQRRNVTNLMVGLKSSHIRKNLTQKWWTPEI